MRGFSLIAVRRVFAFAFAGASVRIFGTAFAHDLVGQKKARAQSGGAEDQNENGQECLHVLDYKSFYGK